MVEEKYITVWYKRNNATETFTLDASPEGLEIIKKLMIEGAKRLFPSVVYIFKEV